MNAKPDMSSEPIRRLFLKFLIPSICSTLVTSIYILADSIIIGKSIGSDGIAALNILLPLFNLYFAFGYLFGVGAGVLSSIERGKKNHDDANRIFTNSLAVIALLSAVILIISAIFFVPITDILGTNDYSRPLVNEYGHTMTLFSFIFILSAYLQVIVRNDKAPKTAMAAVISGGVINTVLDLVFIYPCKMGMFGAILASVIGNACTVLILLSHFIFKRNEIRAVRCKVSLVHIKKMFFCGFPSAVIELSAGIIIFVFNLQALKYYGNPGVVVFSVISNTVIIANSILNGISQAAQPILANNYGAGLTKRVDSLRRMAAAIAFVGGGLICAFCFFFPQQLIDLYVYADQTILSIGINAVRIYFTAIPFAGLNILYCTYFQSVAEPNKSLLISLLRGLVLCILFVYLFPVLFGAESIWYSVAVAEVLAFASALVLSKKR